MRIRITFSGPVSLPVAHHRILQRAFYHLLPETDVAAWHASHAFRPFTFSRLLGRAHLVDHTLVLRGPVDWWLSFAYARDASEALRQLTTTRSLTLGTQTVPVTGLEVEPAVPWNHRVMGLTTLSPIVADDNVDGRIISYAPEDPQFAAHIAHNAAAKAQQFLGDKGEPITIWAVDSLRVRSWYGTTPVVGYRGTFMMQGSPPILQLLYDIGVGRRNGVGFGCCAAFLPEPAEKGRI